jgi:hypothetical protein
MTTIVVARAVLMAGALLLVLGPGMQARLEMREYHELLDALKDSDMPAATQEYLRLLAVGPSMVLRSPLGLLEFIFTGPAYWYPRYRAARGALAEDGALDDERVVEIRTHLAKARNWAIVMAGSLLIMSGTAIELLDAIATGATAA